VRRRKFITLVGGTAAGWPLAARAQQSTMPVIGYLGVGAPTYLFAVFKQSLAEGGFVEGRDVAIETSSADGRYERLPALAADLVRRQVAVIVAITGSPALAAKGAQQYQLCSMFPMIPSRLVWSPALRSLAAMRPA